MSRLGVVLVVLVVLMAGCSGFAGGDDTSDREPYGVEEQVNTSIEDEPEDLLPGLTTEGLMDSEELRETHEDVIGDQSYTIEIEHEHVIEGDNESFRQTSESTLYVDPEAEVAHEVSHHRFEGNISIVSPHADAEPNRTVEQWFGEDSAIRTEFENGTVEYTPPQDGMLRGHYRVDQASIFLLAPLQNVEETTTAGAVESEEGTYYVVEGEENASEEELGPNQEELAVEVRTLVREDGLVRQTVDEQTSVGIDGQRTTIDRTIEVTAIGETTVERPDWYEDAIEAHPEAFEEASAGNDTTEADDEDAPDENETDGNETAGDESEANGNDEAGEESDDADDEE